MKVSNPPPPDLDILPNPPPGPPASISPRHIFSRSPGKHEQIDQGECSVCLTTDAHRPCIPEIVIAKPSNSVTLRREIDRLARQMGRMQVELRELLTKV